MKNGKYEVSLNPEMATYDPAHDDSKKPPVLGVVFLMSFYALVWFCIGFVLGWAVL